MFVTKKQAQEQGSSRYFTGRPCGRGHLSDRLVSSRACCECASESNRKRYQANPDNIRAQVAIYRKNNPEKIVAQHHSWRQRHSESERARDRKRFMDNREAYLARLSAWNSANPERTRARVSAWAKANPDKVSAANARHRADKLQRTPAWADQDAITGMYELAAVFRGSGLRIEVDHEIPLRGRIVSGLHVHENLRLIHSAANKSKSNHF